MNLLRQSQSPREAIEKDELKKGNLPKLCVVRGMVGVGVLSGWGGVA